MSKIQKTALALFASVGLAALAASCMSAQADGFDWIHDYEAALQASSQEDKPIFAYLETDWCTYCRQMEASTLKNEQLIESLGGDFVWLKLNAEHDEDGRRLRERFSISSYPGMLVLDSQGREWDRFSGYVPAKEFEEKLKRATGPDSFLGLTRRLESDPGDLEARFEIAQRLFEREKWQSAAQAYGEYLGADPGNSFGQVDKALYQRAVARTMSSQVPQALEDLETLEERHPGSSEIPDSVLLRGQLLQHLGRNDESRQAFNTYLEEYPDHGYADRVREILARMKTPDLPMASSH